MHSLASELVWLTKVAKLGKIVDRSYPGITDLCKQIQDLPPDVPVTQITELFSGLNILYNHENNSLFERGHKIFEDPTMGRKSSPRILDEDSEAPGCASNDVISLDKEPETRIYDGNPVTRHAESEEFGSATLDGISLNKEPKVHEWVGSPVTRHADSEDHESASYDGTAYNEWDDQEDYTSYADSSLGFKAHGDDQHNVKSYRRFPLHDDPFDCDLFKDEVIMGFVSKYDDILSDTSESLELRKANQVSKISLNKEPEIRDLDGNSVTSYDTSEDLDSGPEADEADQHKRMDLYHDPFDCDIFKDDLIVRFISENDKSLSDTSSSTDGPKKRRRVKKIKKTRSRPRSLTKAGPRISINAIRKKRTPSGLIGSKDENRITDPQKDNGPKLVDSDSQKQSKHYQYENDFFQDDSYEHHLNNVNELDSDSQSQSKHHGDVTDVFQEATLKHQKEDPKNFESKTAPNQDGDSQSQSEHSRPFPDNNFGSEGPENPGVADEVSVEENPVAADEVDVPQGPENPGVADVSVEEILVAADEVDVPRVSQYRITRFSALFAEREKKNRERREKGEPELGQLERKSYKEFGISREKRKKKRSIKSRTIPAPTSKASHHDAARKDGPNQTQRGGTASLSASMRDIPASSPFDMPTPNPTAEDWAEKLITQLLTHEPQELAELLKGQEQFMIASIFYQASVLASNGKINMSQNEHGEVVVSKAITD